MLNIEWVSFQIWVHACNEDGKTRRLLLWEQAELGMEEVNVLLVLAATIVWGTEGKDRMQQDWLDGWTTYCCKWTRQEHQTACHAQMYSCGCESELLEWWIKADQQQLQISEHEGILQHLENDFKGKLASRGKAGSVARGYMKWRYDSDKDEDYM